MNTNTIFGFVVGVAAGVGGTLLVDHISNKKEIEVYSDVAVEFESDKDSITVPNKENRLLKTEKPDLEDVPIMKVRDEYILDAEKMIDYSKYAELAGEYNPAVGIFVNANEVAKEIAPVGDGSIESHNVFDNAEPVSEEFDKKDAIPPEHRNKKVVGPHDIVEISDGQYRLEAPDYEKVSCTYFENDGIVANADTLEIMDINTTVGREIIHRFDSEDAMVLFVSNLSTEVDYEIVASDVSYEEALALLNGSDRECQNETS